MISLERRHLLPDLRSSGQWPVLWRARGIAFDSVNEISRQFHKLLSFIMLSYLGHLSYRLLIVISTWLSISTKNQDACLQKSPNISLTTSPRGGNLWPETIYHPETRSRCPPVLRPPRGQRRAGRRSESITGPGRGWWPPSPDPRWPQYSNPR